MALQIRGVHHIVLTVSDPNRSAEFYEQLLGKQASREHPTVRWISCGTFLLAFQRPPHAPLPNDRFDENRLGLDHVGFSVATRQHLEELLEVLVRLGVPTAGVEFDPDGQSEYVCFRDPDNIQVEFYVGDYTD
jgi:glyoxylase I family protein